MRFIIKTESVEVGQLRVKNCFLWLPKKINNEIRWLEKASIKQISKKMDVGGSCEWGKYEIVWEDLEFC